MVSVCVFYLSFMSMKSVSYFARFALLITVFVVGFLLMQVSVINYFKWELRQTFEKQGSPLPPQPDYEKPMFPGFIIVFSMGAGVFEGIPLCPSLFSNARDQSQVNRMIFLAVFSTGVLILVLSPLCVYAYSKKL